MFIIYEHLSRKLKNTRNIKVLNEYVTKCTNKLTTPGNTPHGRHTYFLFYGYYIFTIPQPWISMRDTSSTMNTTNNKKR